jgi:3-oxoacyl-[acyl-carrier-protein] synthase II
MGRVAILAALAAEDAARDAGFDRAYLSSGAVGAAISSTTGSGPVLVEFFSDYARARSFESQKGTTFMKIMGHTAAANTALYLGLTGRLLSPASACASATQAVGLGFEAIRFGLQEAMLCGGADDIHATTAAVFDIVYAASRGYNDRPGCTPRPFDRDRDGLVVSEGAAVVALEERERAVRRGARIYGEVLAFGTNSDGSHITEPSHEGMLRCMKETLRAGALTPADIDYINAHATGTRVGDAAEASATRALFGEATPISSTKGHTGHTLAACGALEAIFCLIMMHEGFLAPTRNLEHIAEECQGLQHLREVRAARPRRAMTNNFAFGGVNASLILEAPA